MSSKRNSPSDESYDLGGGEGPRRSYLIATTPRSGSHYLAHLLQATGQLGCPFEYLHPDILLQLRHRLAKPDQNSALREIRRLRTAPTGWFGMKAHWHQFNSARAEWQVDQDLIRFDKFILLERHDRVAQAVSLTIAQQTKSWSSLMPLTTAELRFKLLDVHSNLQIIERENGSWSLYFQKSGIEPYRICYEDLVRDPLRALNDLLLDFGAEPVRSLPPIPIIKQATERNRDWQRRYERHRRYNPFLRARDIAKGLQNQMERLMSG